MSLNENLMEKIILEYKRIEKKLEDNGFVIVGIKDIDNKPYFLIKEKE